MKRKVEIVIDELVLHGFDPADRYAIGEALSAELEHLIGSADFHARNSDSINAGSISIQPGADPEAIGKQAGRAVFTSLTVNDDTKPKVFHV